LISFLLPRPIEIHVIATHAAKLVCKREREGGRERGCVREIERERERESPIENHVIATHAAKLRIRVRV
jgi:hypothetical protein